MGMLVVGDGEKNGRDPGPKAEVYSVGKLVGRARFQLRSGSKVWSR
jgi:hypothetical protein